MNEPTGYTMNDNKHSTVKWGWFVIGALIVACLLAFVVSPFASAWPDGLEKVAEHLGFIETAKITAKMPIPDYMFPGIGNEGLATGVAGVVGTLITFGAVYLFARIIKKKSDKGS
ncbi:MAG: PDGLE domain-containing protein [Actinomycetota bacterium]